MNVIALGNDIIGGPSNAALSTSVSCSVGATSCTIADARILNSSFVLPFYNNASGATVSISSTVVTPGQAVITFEPLVLATDFRLMIING